jgi:hypothetical protein
MSPEDADKTDAQAVAGAETAEADAVEKKSRADPMAFLGKAGDSFEKVPGFNKLPRTVRIIPILLIVIILFAVLVIALGGSDEPSDQGPNVIKPERLEDWSWTSEAIQGNLNEGAPPAVILLDDLVPANGTFFVDSISLTLDWEDEPDTFQVEINASMNVSAISPETTNDAASDQGSIPLSLDVGSAGFSYIIMGNVSDVKLADDILVSSIEVLVYMIEAGDYHSPPPEFVFINDFGNAYTLTVTLAGKILPA